MTLTGFLAYSGALAIAVALPGPGVTALVARALGSGFRSALAMSLGIVLGDIVYLPAGGSADIGNWVITHGSTFPRKRCECSRGYGFEYTLQVQRPF